MVGEFLLEILNVNWGLAALALTIICGIYLAHETLALGFSVWEWRSRASRRMRLALAIMTLSVGVAVRSIEVARWRAMGARPDDLDQVWLTVGSVVALVGFLCCIREISKPIYGDGPWIWTLVAMAFYTALVVALRFL